MIEYETEEEIDESYVDDEGVVRTRKKKVKVKKRKHRRLYELEKGRYGVSSIHYKDGDTLLMDLYRFFMNQKNAGNKDFLDKFSFSDQQ
jgi:hypothetical protein